MNSRGIIVVNRQIASVLLEWLIHEAPRPSQALLLSGTLSDLSCHFPGPSLCDRCSQAPCVLVHMSVWQPLL